MELVRKRTLERPFHGIGVDTRRWKGERETNDHLNKDCQREARRGGRAGMCKASARDRWGWTDNVTALCAFCSCAPLKVNKTKQ